MWPLIVFKPCVTKYNILKVNYWSQHNESIIPDLLAMTFNPVQKILDHEEMKGMAVYQRINRQNFIFVRNKLEFEISKKISYVKNWIIDVLRDKISWKKSLNLSLYIKMIHNFKILKILQLICCTNIFDQIRNILKKDKLTGRNFIRY